MEVVEQLLPLASAFFGHADDGISEEVFPFITEYIKLLKTIGASPYHRAALHAQILRPCIFKMRYDEDYDFDRETEEEEDFLQYRKELRRILVNIAHLVSVHFPFVCD